MDIYKLLKDANFSLREISTKKSLLTSLEKMIRSKIISEISELCSYPSLDHLTIRDHSLELKFGFNIKSQGQYFCPKDTHHTIWRKFIKKIHSRKFLVVREGRGKGRGIKEGRRKEREAIFGDFLVDLKFRN